MSSPRARDHSRTPCRVVAPGSRPLPDAMPCGRPGIETTPGRDAMSSLRARDHSRTRCHVVAPGSKPHRGDMPCRRHRLETTPGRHAVSSLRARDHSRTPCHVVTPGSRPLPDAMPCRRSRLETTPGRQAMSCTNACLSLSRITKHGMGYRPGCSSGDVSGRMPPRSSRCGRIPVPWDAGSPVANILPWRCDDK